MDQRGLVGLLYRADWTRLALTGTVRGGDTGLDTIVIETDDASGSERSWSTGPFGPPFGPPSAPPFAPFPPFPRSSDDPDTDTDTERTLIVAPGKRYREETTDGGYASGCDGERVWQWYDHLRPGISLRFDDRPRPPVPVLLAPSWLLTGYELTIEGEESVSGRAGLRVLAVRRERGGYGPPIGRISGIMPVPSRLLAPVETWDEVRAVVDVELGLLLRCWRRRGTGPAEVNEFRSLAVGGGADDDPARFSAPEGSVSGVGRERDDVRWRVFAREAGKTVGGMAAGGIGAVIRAGSTTHEDPFARATAEESDPEAEMPGGDPAPPERADPAGATVHDEVLQLLYRTGTGAPRIAATLHEWFDFGALLEAVPESARRTGFGGVGFLLDSILGRARDDGTDGAHEVRRLRIGGWDRYRIDVTRPSRWGARGRERWQTIAGDGTRTWKVYTDRVVARPAGPLPGEIADLLDASWLLACELSDGQEVTVDGGRRGFRVVVRKPEARPSGIELFLDPGTAGGPLEMWGQLFFPAVAVVDAESGRLLRLTRYQGGRAVLRQELRDVADVAAADDFGFTPPAGLPVEEKTEEDPPPRPRGAAGTHAWAWPRESHRWSGEGINPGDAARNAADAVKKQVDEKIAAARGFLDSFLGGGGGGGRR
jgi:hypothetical protein